MSWATAVVLIVLISAVASVLRSRAAGSRRLRRHEQQQQLPSAREQELEREVDDLRERIHVLERIATEGNTPDARETRRIAQEIEALRDDKRS